MARTIISSPQLPQLKNRKSYLSLVFSFVDRSSIKQKTFDPVWNEEFIHEVENANTLGITVFHKAPIDDVFNANTTITFEDLIARKKQQQEDFWVDLEPSGKLHVRIDLRWSRGELTIITSSVVVANRKTF